MAVQFELHRRLGSGHFGEVWLATETGLDITRAVKLIPQDKVLDQKNFFHEAQILKAVEHPNIVRVEDTGIGNDGRIYVSMEYLERGSLEDEVKGAYVDLTRTRRIMIDVLRGLEHSHDQGILHRDIKPANILIGDSAEGKLSDFGLAVPKGFDHKKLGVKEYGYLLHLAPEVIQNGNYSVASDIFACGVTLYRLVNGDTYVPGVSAAKISEMIAQAEFPERGKYRDFIPRPVRVLINKAVNINPKRRFQTAAEMRHALEKLTLEMNWIEKSLTSGTEWKSSWNNRCYEVVQKKLPEGRWAVTVKKGPSKKKMRRVNKLCTDNLSKMEAQRNSRRILQDFVLGRTT